MHTLSYHRNADRKKGPLSQPEFKNHELLTEEQLGSQCQRLLRLGSRLEELQRLLPEPGAPPELLLQADRIPSSGLFLFSKNNRGFSHFLSFISFSLVGAKNCT